MKKISRRTFLNVMGAAGAAGAAGALVGGQAVLGRQLCLSTPWLTERHGYDPT